jgi:hypothetical protein
MAEALACMEQSEKRKRINAKLMEGMTKEFPRHGQGLIDGNKRRGETPRHLPPMMRVQAKLLLAALP